MANTVPAERWARAGRASDARASEIIPGRIAQSRPASLITMTGEAGPCFS